MKAFLWDQEGSGVQSIMECLGVVLVFSGIDPIPELIGLQLLQDETQLLKSLSCSLLSA